LRPILIPDFGGIEATVNLYVWALPTAAETCSYGTRPTDDVNPTTAKCHVLLPVSVMLVTITHQLWPMLQT